ncbi:hypothetical protein AB0D63_20920 [Kitasatospora sp. NPDC048343]|uniref:hypothetical protein n=1 Tax=Kitasatospora sp. NPDC048343 TaxID=3154717 RepID=UPI0034006812
MGAIQQPTRAMGPYAVEIRSESFYLTRTEAEVCTAPNRHEAVVPASDLPYLAAAFRQVSSHKAWRLREWADGDPSDTSWALPLDGEGEAPAASWEVSRDGEKLSIRGPWIVFAELGRGLLSTELCYLNLTDLDEALKALDSEAAAH